MSNVEDDVVNMKFNNADFEKNVTKTMGTLGKLKAALGFTGASKGIDQLQTSASRFSLKGMLGHFRGAETAVGDLQKSANRFNVAGITTAASSVGKTFTAASLIAIGALSQITSKALIAGAELTKKFTIAPLIDGFKEYELTLNSIQTILANTKMKGETLETVNAALDELNAYSDKTIYNFGQMADSVKTFTAAGVDLDESVQSIKGMSNVAALFGVNATDAARGMFQLSRGMASGIIRLQDWMSLENSGMAGVAFQDSLKETARVHGVKIDEMIKDSGSFRNSLEKNWLTSAIMVETLAKFTGDLSDKQLENMGYTREQVKDIQELAKSANDSATKVKTLTQLMGTLSEASGSGWSKTWRTIFGDLGEAQSLFTGLNNVLGGWITQSADARNKVLSDWKDLGGRTILIEAIGDAFHAVLRVLRPIKNAFRDIFPAKTAGDLLEMTKAFGKFAENAKIGDDTMHNLRRTFAGVFAILDIGWKVVKAIFGVFGDLFGVMGDKSGGFLSFTGNVGDFLVKINEMLEKSNGIEKFFDKLVGYLKVPLGLLVALGQGLSKLTDGFGDIDFGKLAGGAGDLVKNLNPMEKVAAVASKAWDVLIGFLEKIKDLLGPVIDTITSAFEGLGEGLAASISSGNFNAVLQIINTTLLGGILLLVKKFFGKVFNIDLGTGVLGELKGVFGELGDTLQAFQNQLNAKALLLIAGAVALLAASVIALSFVDPKKLNNATKSLGILFGGLLVAMGTLNAITTTAGFLKMPFIAASLILLATAILLLTGAMKVLATMKWDELAKGLAGVGGLMLGLSLAVKPMAANAAGMISAGLGIIALSIGIKILASAVRDFAELSVDELVKGVGAVILTLFALAGAMKLMDGGQVKGSALAIVAMAIAMKILASAIGDLGKMDQDTLKQGLLGVASALAIIAVAMAVMPKDMLLQSVALLAVSTALVIMAKALEAMGNLKDVGQSIVVLGLTLLTLALGLNAMTGALAGAAALVVATAALTYLVPVLIALGAMSWESIAKGLVAIAGAFVVLGIAGVVLGPLTPVIMGLSAALFAVGAGLALAGAGAFLFATAFAIFAAAGTAGIVVISGIIQLIPLLIQNFALGIIAFITTMAKNTGTLVGALLKLIEVLLGGLLDLVVVLAPKLAKAIQVLVDLLIQVFVKNIPELAAAAFEMVITLLEIFEENLPELQEAGANLLIAWLKGIGEHTEEIASAALQMIVDFLNGIATAIDANRGDLTAAGLNLARALIDGMTGGLLSEGLNAARNAAETIAAALPGWMKKVLGINSPSKETYWIGQMVGRGLVDGVISTDLAVKQSAKHVGNTAMVQLKESFRKVKDVVGRDLDMNPVITPVVNLTSARKSLAELNDMFGSANQPWGGSTWNDWRFRPHEDPWLEFNATVPGGGGGGQGVQAAPKVEITQNNHSPRSLSEAEIYRNNKSLIPLMKEALEI